MLPSTEVYSRNSRYRPKSVTVRNRTRTSGLMIIRPRLAIRAMDSMAAWWDSLRMRRSVLLGNFGHQQRWMAGGYSETSPYYKFSRRRSMCTRTKSSEWDQCQPIGDNQAGGRAGQRAFGSPLRYPVMSRIGGYVSTFLREPV